MSDSEKNDLRSIKTNKTLSIAIFSLLKTYNFKQITVMHICKEAMISRAAFYAHYSSKYELLKSWLINLNFKDIVDKEKKYEQLEVLINDFTQKNRVVINHLIYDVDEETLWIIFDFMLSILEESSKKKYNSSIDSVFCVSGIIGYYLWQMKNRFPAETPIMNKRLYAVINEIRNLKI